MNDCPVCGAHPGLPEWHGCCCARCWMELFGEDEIEEEEEEEEDD